jgi:hypothetical protein
MAEGSKEKWLYQGISENMTCVKSTGDLSRSLYYRGKYTNPASTKDFGMK